jgi:hypothetical protein
MLQVTDLKPGQRVRITQTIERRERDWQQPVEGVVQSVDMQKTGSWHAHSKDNRYWLIRVRLTKESGEQSLINVDTMTRIELLS